MDKAVLSSPQTETFYKKRDYENTVFDIRSKNNSLLSSDLFSILLLIFLYMLQGIPLGLAGSVPYILQSRKADYKAQATYSFSFWPFSLKLLWAPLVDSLSCARFGRRKTWLVPVQFLIGFVMILISTQVSDWLGEDKLQQDHVTSSLINGTLHTASKSLRAVDSPVEIIKLTAAFFILKFLAATQDIVVDGWALTMLSRDNVGWASTCNVVGQTIGYFIAFTFFLVLESPEFCNTWLRSKPESEGLITFSGFLVFWGIVYMVATTLVMIFKTEVSTPSSTSSSTHLPSVLEKDEGIEGDVDEIKLGMVDTYKMLWKIIQLSPVQTYVLVFACVRFGFSATDTLVSLKLIEKGVSKERLAFLAVCLVPLQITLPLTISRLATGSRPLSLYFFAAWPRLFMGLVGALVVFLTPVFKLSDGSYSFHFYATLLVLLAIYQLFHSTMMVVQMAFHAKVSDPAIGGTYMTLLNTVVNLAGTLPATVLLYFVDPLTQKSCEGGSHHGLDCKADQQLKICTSGGGVCSTLIDGYYIELSVCLIVGTFGLVYLRPKALRLESLPMTNWLVTKKSTPLQKYRQHPP